MKAKIKIPALIILTAIIGWMSYELYARAQAQLLWGYRPLLLLLAGWMLIALLIYQPNRLLGYATLSGFLLGLGFPGWLPLPFLVFGALVPLLFIERHIATNYHRAKPGMMFKYSWHTFIIWNILSTWWIANSSLVAGIFAIVANSLLMTIPFVLAHQTRQVMTRLGYAPLIAYWLVFEYLHYNWELNYPWLTLGNSFAQFPAFVQWYEYSGVLGGSLWILIANILIFDAIKKQPNFRVALLRLVALMAIPIAFSLYQYFTFVPSGKNIEVVIVQPNYEPHYEENNVPEPVKLERCLELASQQVSESTDFLIFPEATFGFVETHQINDYTTFQRLREWMKPYPKLHIISGVNAYHIFQPSETPSAASRTDTSQTGEIIRYEVFNAAIQLSPNSQQVQLHKKSRLVPGPESFPFKRLLAFLKPVVQRFGGTTAGLGTELQPVVFDNGTARLAPLICYESAFGEYVTDFTRRGAEAIFTMTNDGWWDNTAGHRQHLAFASLRAIENRRGMARAANTGISAFISPRGDLLQPTRYNEPATIKTSLPIHSSPTFYMQWGDMIGRLSLFAAAIFVLNVFVQSIVRKE